MISHLEQSLLQHRKAVYLLFRRYLELKKPLLVRSDLLEHFEAFCETGSGESLPTSFFGTLILHTQEAVVIAPSLYLAVRSHVGDWRYYHFHTDDVLCREIPVSEYLEIKEALVRPASSGSEWVLTVDLAPFNREFPKLKEVRSIGRGVEFLNRHLSSMLFNQDERGYELLVSFLKLHHHEGQQLMLNERVESAEALRKSLRKARSYLETLSGDSTWSDVEFDLQELGFEPGWGRSTGQVLETMAMLSDILEASGPQLLESFLSRLPMIFSLAIISPHGYFGQSNVLGKPDTGGQVVYILDQVRALEKEMRQSIHDQGLDIEPQIVVLSRLIPEAGNTSCNQHIEPIIGTQNARILRVPFRSGAGEVIPHWVSRFKIWPYLERFTIDAETEILAELGGTPDLIIGNYSDGNLVATLLANRMEATKCTIAHALEKTKYLHSDLHWQDLEEEFHFSCQFSADLMAMNSADFIICSTYQEIAGTKDTVGQYENYSSFSMPGLFRVENGIDLFDPKFNIVSPGADPEIFFPYSERERRIEELGDEMAERIYGEPSDIARGQIRDRDKPILFAMSRLDRIKNVTSLVRWYAESERMRELTNLFVVGGLIDPSQSDDEDEKSEIDCMHQLFDKYKLDSQMRWLVMQTDKNVVGELYRVVADSRGAFVQPALFEAFGLTVIEAMSSGLPTFATCNGGPLEIIVEAKSGFHINPNSSEQATECICNFFEKIQEEPCYWQEISDAAVIRVAQNYTWKLYAERLMSLSRIYGFWKYVSKFEREETRHYLDMFYALMYRRRAELVEGP